MWTRGLQRLVGLWVGVCACGSAGGGSGADSEAGVSSTAAPDGTSGGGATSLATSSGATGGSAGVTEGGTSSGGASTQGPTSDALTSTSAASTGPATDTAVDTSSSGTTGESSGGGSTEGGSTEGPGSGSSSSGSSSGTTGEPVQEGLWLTMIEDTSSPTRLYKIDLETGASTLLCQLNVSDDYNTSTFSRDGLLFTANATTKNLEIINPCDCQRTVVGPTLVAALPGITADQALGLYGMDTSLDNFVALSTMTGNATVIGPFGLDWGTGGLTWSDVLKDTYAINGSDDKLYTINHTTGKATALIQTNYNFGSVGIEWHPKTGEIYACSNPSELLLVSEKTGEVSVVGPMNLENKAAHCDNLAAPWVPVPCVENK